MKIDEALAQEIDEAYSSIFVESKLFKSKVAVNSMDIEDVAEYAFMSIISLWVMYCVPLTKQTAIAYADRTMSFGNFKQERNMATDLYVALNTLVNPVGKISTSLANQAKNVEARKSIRVNQQLIKSFLDSMASGRIDSTDASRFLLKLERMLNIHNIMYKSVRRMAQDWPSLNPHERNQVMSRIMQYFNLHAKRSELKPFLEDMARAEGYKLGDAPDPEDKSDTVKALAVAAAALYGGYRLGKAMLPDVKKLFK